MSNEHEHRELPPVDLPTVAAIAAWGRSQRMPAELAEAIFSEIIATPAPESVPVRPVPKAGPVLDATWWRSHAASLAATMVTSTRWTSAA